MMLPLQQVATGLTNTGDSVKTFLFLHVLQEVTKATSAHCSLITKSRNVLLVSVKWEEPDLVAQREIHNGCQIWGFPIARQCAECSASTVSFILK